MWFWCPCLFWFCCFFCCCCWGFDIQEGGPTSSLSKPSAKGLLLMTHKFCFHVSQLFLFFFSLCLPVYYKGYHKGNGWTAKWRERCIGQGTWEGVWGFHVLTLNLHTFTNLEAFQISPLGFYRSFITEWCLTLIRHWWWVQPPAPLPYPKSGGRTERSNPLITWLVLWEPAPNLRCIPKQLH